MKSLLIVFIFILIILFFIYCISFGWGSQTMREKWQNYMDLPFDFLDTGSNPLNFYQKNKYRKPYRWPYKFKQSYPLPSMQAYPLL